MHKFEGGCIYPVMQPSSAVFDDASLLRLYARTGDAGAFAELVGRYADMVYATARRVTGSAAAAEDVAQDCFLRLAQGSAAVSGSVAAWLHRTSLNRSLEIVRSEQSRRRRESAAAAMHADLSSARGESGGDESHELIARVDEALAALPDELRAAVTEHFLCGRSQAEIAAASGLSQSTVSRRIDAGVTQLRLWLRTNGVVASAVAGLPSLLEGGLPEMTAPQPVRAALTKIGMSGVRGGAAGTTAATTVVTSHAIFAACAIMALIGGGLWLLVRPPAAPTPPPTATITSPGGTRGAAPATSAPRGDNDDEGADNAQIAATDDDDDEEEMDDDDLGMDDDDDDEVDDRDSMTQSHARDAAGAVGVPTAGRP